MTSTHEAVMVTVGTIGVFFIGLAMLFAPLKYFIAREIIIEPETIIHTPLVIEHISNGSFNIAYSPSEIGPDFMRDDVQLAGSTGAEILGNPIGGAAITSSKSPLMIRFGNSLIEDNVTVPANTATIVTYNGEIPPVVESEYTFYTLCVPQTTIQAYDYTTNDYHYVYYFYDTDGTPYTDATLTHKISCGNTNSCTGCDSARPPACCSNINEELL